MTSTVGRLMNNCRHQSGWEPGDGEEQCRICGTRRFTNYGALRPPGLPVALTPAPRDKARADRSAAIAIAHALRGLGWWRPSGASFCPAA